MTAGARRAAHRLAWSLVVLFAVVIGIGTANLLFTTSQVHSVQHAQEQIHQNTVDLQKANAKLAQQIKADCGWYHDVSGLPITVPPGGSKPSIVVPRLVSDARASWVGHGCPGHLPAPSATFVKWARYYHLPVVPDGS
jgi:hypothetical protein